MPKKRTTGRGWRHNLKNNNKKRVKIADVPDDSEGQEPLSSKMDEAMGTRAEYIRQILPTRIVRGSRSQNSPRYGADSRNRQCTANAAVAIAYDKLIPFRTWQCAIIDNVLDHGDELYRTSISARRPNNNNSSELLFAAEVYPNFVIDNVSFSLDIIETATITGHVQYSIENSIELDIPLAEGLIRIFQNFQSAIFTSECQSICVNKTQNKFYLFDSHSRTATGEGIESEGKACLLQFDNLDCIKRFLLRNFNCRELYTLTPVQVQMSSVTTTNVTTVNADTQQQSLPTITSTHYMGEMNYICSYCNALFFPNENMLCCNNGKINLPSNSVYPDLLRALITDSHPRSREFTKNIRRYNTLLALGSTTFAQRDIQGSGAPVIVVSGQIHHRVADVTPSDNCFGYLYFVDSGEATRKRMANNIGRASDNCDQNLLRQIDALLRNTHPYARMYCSLGQVVKNFAQTNGNNAVQELGLYFHYQPETDRKVNAAPTTSAEIGAVFQSLDGDVPPPGAVRIHFKNNDSSNEIQFKEIPRLSPIVDALCYPLIFPNGELGWSSNLPKTVGNKRITMREFECYRLMVRSHKFNAIISCAKLTQQFIVDKYVQIEGDRLNYLRTHQTQLRAENYVGLQDYVAQRIQTEGNDRIGRIVILPSTFASGPRFMIQNYQDAMAIVAKFGRPSLFITFTCNPNWREIKENMGSKSLNPQDRPELIARVFKMKIKSFFEDVLNSKIFGEVIAHVYVIEFQKRGLPHMHCLLFLSDADKPREPERIDRMISAELPPENTELFGIVMSTMIHGPCGNRNPNSPCMIDGKCSKHYPKSFVDQTSINRAWPEYRRRNDGRTASFIRNNVSCTIDNRDVVPYNPFLSLKYQCHVNVEVVTSVGSVKYVFKYINKGPDAAILQVRNETVFDEIQAYIESRYISSMEAAWRLFSFNIQGKSHSICRLPVHLPGERTVYFEEGQEEIALNRPKLSLLEAYFKLNAFDAGARNFTYCDIPLHYSFDRRQCRWVKRVRNCKKISRMYTISPKYVEKFHLRILLLHVPGAKSFEDLRTLNGSTFATFREAVRARGLIASDTEWVRTLEQAALVEMPACMRKLFAYMLCFCEIGDPSSLWTAFKKFMFEDFVRRGYSEDRAEYSALRSIENTLRFLSRSLRDFNLPEPNPDLAIDDDDDDVVNEDDDTRDGSANSGPDPETLNTVQKDIFDRVTRAIESETIEERYFYLQGSGGTGKTYLYNTLLAYCQNNQKKSKAVAFTGIAALLLRNGRTVHSTFKLPLNVDESTRSFMSAHSEEADKLRALKLIIWDEVTMASYHVVNAVDELFRDVCNNQRPFGGKCILLAGDSKQLLPVAPTRVEQVELLFVNCKSWKNFKKLELETNMRALGNEQDFISWLENLGEGKLNTEITIEDTKCHDFVRIPERCLTTDVVKDIYGQVENLTKEQLSMRAILCPRNDHCNTINDRLIAMFPGDEILIRSNDSVASGDEHEIANFPEEYLNSITPSGMPLHKLKLKVGIPIMLLRNLSLEQGLINGTRLLVLSVTDVLLKAEIIIGRFAGRQVLISKADLTSTDQNLPFVLKRRQFPVKVCFALTINKAQGQTFDQVGIYLGSPVFSHGQLYVAFSRARSWDAIKVQVINAKDQGKLLRSSREVFTKNIIYRNVLNSIRN